MEARATARNVRISPRKVRMVLNLIRGQNVPTALAYLDSTPRRATPVVRTLLRSALANAEQQDSGVDVDNLKIKVAYADPGPVLKRFRPRAMGRACPILKRTSHITVVVGE